MSSLVLLVCTVPETTKRLCELAQIASSSSGVTGAHARWPKVRSTVRRMRRGQRRGVFSIEEDLECKWLEHPALADSGACAVCGEDYNAAMHYVQRASKYCRLDISIPHCIRHGAQSQFWRGDPCGLRKAQRQASLSVDASPGRRNEKNILGDGASRELWTHNVTRPNRLRPHPPATARWVHKSVRRVKLDPRAFLGRMGSLLCSWHRRGFGSTAGYYDCIRTEVSDPFSISTSLVFGGSPCTPQRTVSVQCLLKDLAWILSDMSRAGRWGTLRKERLSSTRRPSRLRDGGLARNI